MGDKKKFLITEIVPHFFIWELKKIGFQVDEYPFISREDCLKIIDHYTGLYIRGRFEADRELLSRAVNLKYILRPGSGLDIIDVDVAKLMNITIINSPEGNRDSLGEFTVGALISLLRKIPASYSKIKSGIFERVSGSELMGKIVGIIGFGNMGSAFARRLLAFDVSILAYDKFKKNYAPPGIREVSLGEICREAEIISFHIPYNAENHYFFNVRFLDSVKKPFYLINTSRGKIADTSAIIKGLISGKLLGVFLDVLENEDFSHLTKKEKDELDYLVAQENVIISPHIAGKTKESEERIHEVLIKKLKSFEIPEKETKNSSDFGKYSF